MLSSRNLLSLLTVVLLIFAHNHKSLASTVAKDTDGPSSPGGDSKLSLIIEDVIPDAVDMDKTKVIRLNPLDLPALKEDPNKMSMDSSLYKIQSLKPHKVGKRRYVNSQNMRKARPQPTEEDAIPQTDSHIVRAIRPMEHKLVKPKHQPKKKNLHYLYNQDDLSGNTVTKTNPVHTAPGAYPVYYSLARTNGSFGKYPLKSFSTPEAFMKYLHKKKIENSTLLEKQS